MDKVKSDLHIHLDNNINEKAVKHVLSLAEKNGVKAVCLLEHNELNLYKKGGVLASLIKSGELSQIYSGKIVPGCEVTCIVNKTDPTKYAFNFNNYYVHLTMLDFDIEKAEHVKWFNKKFQNKIFKKDVKQVIKMLKQLKLEVPKKDYFVFEKGVPRQVWEYMHKDAKRLAKYENVLGKFETCADFVRVIFEDPNSKLWFKQARTPYLTEVIQYVREIGARIFISHPCHMNKKFATTSYMDALINVDAGYSFPFDGIETKYFLNTPIDTKVLEDYALARNLEMSGGTDYQYLVSERNPEGKMVLLNNGERTYYVPVPGTMIRTLLETRNGDLLLSKKFVDGLSDIRDQKRFSFKR